MEKNKKIQWIIALYLLLGTLFALYNFLEPLWNQYKITISGFIGLKIFITNILFFPIIIIYQYVFNTYLSYYVYWWSIPIVLFIYGFYRVWIYFRTPLDNEIKHFTLLIIALIIFVSTLSITSNYSNVEIMSSNNYKTIINDFYDIENNTNNTNTFYGFNITNDLSIFFVNQGYMNKFNYDSIDDNLTTLGITTYSNDKIYINYEGIEKYNNDSKNIFQAKIQNTLIHELTHYMDKKNMLGNRCEAFNFTGYNCDVMNPYKYINIYDDTKNSVPEYLRSSVDFKSVFFDRDYPKNQWDDEVVARVNALCLVLDNESNLNKVKVADYDFCKKFTFDDRTINQYNYILKMFVLNYAKTFYGNKQPIKISYNITNGKSN